VVEVVQLPPFTLFAPVILGIQLVELIASRYAELVCRAPLDGSLQGAGVVIHVIIVIQRQRQRQK
jgi:hypothetical protein